MVIEKKPETAKTEMRQTHSQPNYELSKNHVQIILLDSIIESIRLYSKLILQIAINNDTCLIALNIYNQLILELFLLVTRIITSQVINILISQF